MRRFAISCFRRRVGPAVLILVLAGAGGCGGPKIYPVEGMVEYPDGAPAKELAGFKVEFEALDGKIDGRGVSAEGEIQRDGSFRLTTLKPNDGALLGRHRVLIAPPFPEGDVPAPKRLMDPRYHSYETSELKAEVEAKTNKITLTIQRYKK